MDAWNYGRPGPENAGRPLLLAFGELVLHHCAEGRVTPDGRCVVNGAVRDDVYAWRDFPLPPPFNEPSV